MIQQFINQTSEFHKAFGVEKFGENPTQEQIELRYKLFEEELNEFYEGWAAETRGLEEFKTRKGELVKTYVYIVDAICDMIVIATGTLDLHNYRYEINYVQEEFDELDYCRSQVNNLLERYKKNGDPENFDTILLYLIDIATHYDIIDILPELMTEVFESNMSKLEDGKPIINDGVIDRRKPVGKILKGKNYFEPRLEEILIRNGKL